MIVRYSPVGSGKKLHAFIFGEVYSLCGIGCRKWDWDECPQKPAGAVCKNCEREIPTDRGGKAWLDDD